MGRERVILAEGNGNADRILSLVGAAGATIDYDGPMENGAIQAVLGDVEFTGVQADDFDGFLTVDAGRMITFFDPFTLGSGGRMILNGGATPSPTDAAVLEGNAFSISGEVDVYDECLLANFNTIFLDGALVDMIDAGSRLTLENAAIVYPGARFVGPGRLASKSALFLFDGADLACELQSSGTVVVSRAPGVPSTASLGALDLPSGTELSLTITGGGHVTETDLLEVDGHASVGGRLMVNMPTTNVTPGRRWTIMTHGSRTGTFSQVVAPDLPAGMRLSPLYFSDRIELVYQQEQSYDDWRAGFNFVNGAASQSGADADGDGVNNFTEYYFDSHPLLAGSKPQLVATTVTVGGEKYMAVGVRSWIGRLKLDGEAFAEQSSDLITWGEAGAVTSGGLFPAGSFRTQLFRSTAPMSSDNQQFLHMGAREVAP